jgi:hypothetical protein
MMTSVAARSALGAARSRVQPPPLAATAALAGLTVLTGTLAAVKPIAAVAPMIGLLVLALAFVAPVTHLTVLLVTTAVAGYQLQRNGGSHVLPSDLLLLTGLFRAGVVLIGQRLDRRRMAAGGLALALMAGVLLQLVHGVRTGNDPSYAAQEARILLGFAVLFIAMPIVADPAGRRRLARGLVVAGLLLGLWGLAQWGLGIQGGDQQGSGIRAGVDFAVSGSGQLHGGLYGYPVAVVMAATALLSGVCRTRLARLAMGSVLALNVACLFLTYERTFWVTTLAALAFVILKLGRGRRARAALISVVAGLIALGALATFSPQTATNLRERVMSLGQGTSDNSVRYRVVETNDVLQTKIAPEPLTGWGLGNFLHWGQSWEQVPPRNTWFSHNGYLWMLWKTGIVVAGLLFALLGWAVVSRAPPAGGAFMRAFKTASQAGLLLLLLASVTFPSFNAASPARTRAAYGDTVTE